MATIPSELVRFTGFSAKRDKLKFPNGAGGEYLFIEYKAQAATDVIQNIPEYFFNSAGSAFASGVLAWTLDNTTTPASDASATGSGYTMDVANQTVGGVTRVVLFKQDLPEGYLTRDNIVYPENTRPTT